MKARLIPTRTALLVIDVQNDFCHEDGTFSRSRKADLAHARKAVSVLMAFADEVRELGVAVIFIRTVHSEWSNSPAWLGRLQGRAERMSICGPDSWGGDFYRIRPSKSDCVVTKHRYSGFFGTDLDLILRSRSIDTLLVTGVATNVCVESTARDAFIRDYNVVLVEDCCGAFDRVEHEAAVRNVSRYFGMAAESVSVLNLLKTPCDRKGSDETE
jgi:ureidoacrylate peracid hydrolase